MGEHAMRARTRWIAGLAAAAILLTATATAFGYDGQVEGIVGVAAQGTITCGKPFTMTATVLDANGAPVADASVAWSFVTTQSASDSINKTPTVTNAQGVATTTVTLGAVSGDRQIRATTTVGETGATSDVSASGVVNQSCGGLPRTDALMPEIPQGGEPLAAVLVLVLAFAVGGWLTLRRLAVPNR
jgi:Bacterial Ig-like domain (group 1)